MIDRPIINQPYKPFDFPNDYQDTSYWLYRLIQGNLNPLAQLALDTLEERLVEYNKTAKHPIRSMALPPEEIPDE